MIRSRRLPAAGALAVLAGALSGYFVWLGACGARASSDGVPDSIVYENGQYRLLGPRARDAHIGPRVLAPKRQKTPWFALAYQYQSLVFEQPRSKARPMGTVRRGTHLHALGRAKGAGCKQGWYRLAAGGYVCDREGFLISQRVQPVGARQPKADLNRALFYRYARVITQGSPRFVRIPTPEEEKQVERQDATPRETPALLPEVVQTRMVGDYFVALDRIEKDGERSFYRTVRGRYVRVKDIEPRPAPEMHGEVLGAKDALPWAFVYGEEEAPLFRRRRGRLKEVGVAHPHGRFPVEAVRTERGATYAFAPGGFAVPRERVRIATRIARPAGVSKRQKWIHVDLAEQTLVAYDGERPVFVTLVSSGKEETGHATPTGLYQVHEKHVSVTMSGKDPKEGFYEVAEVPWTQFYDGSYALHGAYWHDTFGSTRSHGCTNLAPADARWLFYWTTPELPPGFHARHHAPGTAVYLSRKRGSSP